MGMLSLLFGFTGRVNRAQYWLGGVGAGVVIMLLMTVLIVIGGTPDASLGKEQQLAHFLGVFAMALIPAFLLASWIGYALAWKRFHDRGKSGTWVFLPMPFSFMMMSGAIGAIASGADAIQAASSMQPWSTILFLIQIWFFVELGCLPSKQGPNKYGDQPGGGAPSTHTPSVPSAPAKTKGLDGIPGMKTALGGAESAIDRAIAERAREEAQRPAPTAARAPAAAGGLRPAAAGSFGRKVTQ